VIQGLRQLQVTAEVAEADAADVEVGQPATVRLSATNATATGSVTAITLEDTVSNNVVQYAVTVTLKHPPKNVRLGQTASVEIVTGEAADVLTVPSNAVTTIGQTSTVTISEDGADTTRTVELGLVGDSSTEVISGLEEGQTVVLPDSGTSGSGFTFPSGGLPGGVAGGLG
jgi:HlyD family secretion protein